MGGMGVFYYWGVVIFYEDGFFEFIRGGVGRVCRFEMGSRKVWKFVFSIVKRFIYVEVDLVLEVR